MRQPCCKKSGSIVNPRRARGLNAQRLPICSAGCRTNAPCSSEGDANGRSTGEGDSSEENGPSFSGEVAAQVFGAPVFRQEREYYEHWDREEIVVVHRVPVFEAGGLDTLSHR